MYYTTQHTTPYILPYLMQYILSYTMSYTSTFHVKHSFNFKYIILSPHITTIISYIPNIVSLCYNYHFPLFPLLSYNIITVILSNLVYYIVYTYFLYSCIPLQHLHFPIILWIMFWIMAISYEYHNPP